MAVKKGRGKRQSNVEEKMNDFREEEEEEREREEGADREEHSVSKLTNKHQSFGTVLLDVL